MIFIIYAALVLTRFDRLLLIGACATPTNLRNLAAYVVSACRFTMRGIRCQRNK